MRHGRLGLGLLLRVLGVLLQLLEEAGEEVGVELRAVVVVDGNFRGAEEVDNLLDLLADLIAFVLVEVRCIARLQELRR